MLIRIPPFNERNGPTQVPKSIWDGIKDDYSEYDDYGDYDSNFNEGEQSFDEESEGDGDEEDDEEYEDEDQEMDDGNAASLAAIATSKCE